MPRPRWSVLLAIGTGGGLFSGLFGVGGGAIIVPMLVLRFRYPDRRAMGTSLVAIAVMAGVAMLAQGAYGNLHVDDGLLGVGGGVLFVPALTVFLGLSQIDAEATSLLEIMPMAIVGAWRQHGYGNVSPRDGGILGVAAIPGAVLGVAIVNVVPERVVQVMFAGLMLVIAWRMVRERPRA